MILHGSNNVVTYRHLEEVAFYFFWMNHSHVLNGKRNLQFNKPAKLNIVYIGMCTHSSLNPTLVQVLS